MSGIFGMFNLEGKPVNPRIIHRMKAALSHLGEDDSGVWCQESVGLGHVMLHITPESLHEKIPLPDKTGNRVITSNARLDNRGELCDNLDIGGPLRLKITGGELILRAYEKWGEACPEYLCGDFVFVIWDDVEKKLLCVTDHMGSTPLHFYKDDRVFAFASEAKAILTIPGIRKGLNKEKVAHSLVFGLPEDHRSTFFKDIYLLPAATLLTVKTDAFRERSYWEPGHGKTVKFKKDAEYYDYFRELFFETMASCMRSHFPVGVLLSGGLDSSAIACTASRILKEKNERLVAVSSVLPENWEGTEKDERSYIDMVHKQENLDLHYVTPPMASVFDRMEEYFLLKERPVTSYRQYLYTALYERAGQKHARIVLDGCGGESGPSSPAQGLPAEMALTFQWLRLLKEINAAAGKKNRSRLKLFLYDVLLPSAPVFIQRHYAKIRHGTSIGIKESSLIKEEFARQMGLFEKLDKNLLPFWSITAPNVRKNQVDAVRVLRFPLGTMGIARNLNAVYPFLNKRLVDFYLAVPSRILAANGWGRLLIRKSMEGIMPEKIQWRTTKGAFSPDYHRRLEKSGPHAREILSGVSQNHPAHEFIDIQKLKNTLETLDKQPSWKTAKTKRMGDPAKVIVQRGILFTCFLRWFEEFSP